MKATKSLKAALVILCLLHLVPTKAQDVKSLWMSMPTQMTQYLDDDMKRTLVDGGNGHVEVKNLLGETTVLDTLTADFMQVKLNQATMLQLKALDTDSGKREVCVVRTFTAPEGESTATLYDADWNLVGTIKLPTMAETLLQKPDTLSEAAYTELKSQITMVMTRATLAPDNKNIKISPSIPLTDKEQQKRLKALLVQKELKWNGETFK